VIGPRGLLLAGAVVMLAVVASRLELRTDVTHFMPTGDAHGAAALMRHLSQAELTRSMILSIEAEDLSVAMAAARSLESTLGENPQVAWIRTGIDQDQMRQLYELYFPRRHQFLSDRPDDPQRGIPALLSEQGLRARARELRRQLSMPASPLLERLAAEDPLGGFARFVTRVRGTDPGMQIRDGQFVARDGCCAIVLLATRDSAFDTGSQAPFLASMSAAFEEIRRTSPDAKLVLERSGINRFAVKIEEEIQRDVTVIMACSFVGVAVLFLLFFRSPAVFGLAVLPSVYGILVAATLGVLAFGDLDALTLVFGACLIGVAIDYSIHLMNHHGLATGGEDARQTARRLRPSIVVGALTTMASFAGLGLTSFPGFRQMGSFAIVGVGAALILTLYVLPLLLSKRRPVPTRSRRLAEALGRSVVRLDARRGWLWLVPAASLAFAAISLPGLRWNDDISSLSQLDPTLMEEGLRVRERVSQFDSSRFVIVSAPTEELALQRNDAVALSVEEAIDRGELEGMRSLHSLLWSSELQERNLAAVRADTSLAQRINRSFAAEGFRPDAFASYGDTLATDAPPPLTLAELRKSAAGELLRSLVVQSEDQTTVITYLRGVRSEAAVREAIAAVPGARIFDQTAFTNEIYGAFRATTLRQIAIGSALVIAVLLLRYRRLRPALAAFLPSVLTALLLLSLLAAFGVEANLLHAVSLVMVMGMGVDYGVFVVDSSGDSGALGATMLSLLLSCLTTVFVFGALAFSSHPAMRAMGVTTSLGIALSFLLAPVTVICLGGAGGMKS